MTEFMLIHGRGNYRIVFKKRFQSLEEANRSWCQAVDRWWYCYDGFARLIRTDNGETLRLYTLKQQLAMEQKLGKSDGLFKII